MITFINDQYMLYKTILYNVGSKSKNIFIIPDGYSQRFYEDIERYLIAKIEDEYRPVIKCYENVIRYDNTYIIAMIDNGAKIRGLRANNIVVYKPQFINQEDLDVVILGLIAVSSNPLEEIKKQADNE